MKVVILTGPSPSTVFSHAPLGAALRNAGHQVMMTSCMEEMIPIIVGVGFSALPITDPDLPAAKIIAPDGTMPQLPAEPIERERLTGRWYARLEAVTLDALLAFAQDWRPDVVIGGVNAYAAPLLATRLGVPYVRQAWDINDPREMDLGAAEELREQLAELGLDRFPDPDMMIEITPPSLLPPDAAPAQMMRWIPGNSQCRLEPWMYTRGAGTRVGVTIGTGVIRHNELDFLHEIVEHITALDAEVVVPVQDEAAPVLRERVKNVRAGWIPLDVLAPTCDVLVHQTGGSTMMTALSFGVPQILIPDPGMWRQTEMANRLAEVGAAIVLTPEEAASDAIVKSCQEIISNPAYAAAAAALAREIAALPSPSEVAHRIESLVHEASRGGRD
ncbi:glycosyltransferase [Micromonospora sp. RTGN7]|uniref:glycosyltransferase n=1 Tax=Micromonospora sp. RTGN7 TaxID=3016526 RepID=UPI0029FEE9FA|nr:glycosyltransferase [Micromonospora sp. RTGN7]